MNKEEKRFWAAALILAAFTANYSYHLIPDAHWTPCVVKLADNLLKVLEETSREPQNVSE